jgi:hypothetical protein
MNKQTNTSKLRMSGRIDTQVHSEEDLRNAADGEYDSLSKKERLSLAREVEPEYKDTVHNVTTDRLHEYFVDNLDPDDTSPEANISASFMGLGTDGAAGTSSSDTDLNNRTYEETISDVADNGKDLLASTFLNSTEGNGNTFDEIGLFTGDPANLADDDVFLINHATFADVTKDNSKTVTFDVTLSFSDV